MPDLRTYMKAIENKIGQTSVADGIRGEKEALWTSVVEKLDELSKKFAQELGKETGRHWDKGTYTLGLEEAPPMRLLTLAIMLSGWLGWIIAEKHPPGSELDPDRCLQRLVLAFEYGRYMSLRGDRP